MENKNNTEKQKNIKDIANNEKNPDNRICVYDKIAISEKGVSIFISVISIVLVVSLILFIILNS